MKKFAIACAIVLAAGMMTSCGDTNYCWEITTTVTVLGTPVSTTGYWWGTKNDLDTHKQELKDAQKQMGIAEDAITIDSKKASKSQDDCK
mgnify:CR=1 FL=1